MVRLDFSGKKDRSYELHRVGLIGILRNKYLDEREREREREREKENERLFLLAATSPFCSFTENFSFVDSR